MTRAPSRSWIVDRPFLHASLFGWKAIVTFLALANCATEAAEKVEDYRVSFASCRAPDSGKPLVVLRAFRQASKQWVLAVDSVSLATRLLPAGGLKLSRLTYTKLRSPRTPYVRALTDSEKNSSLLQDAGLIHSLPPGKGVILTIDLCPSTRPLDRNLFSAVLTNFAPEEKPVPLGIAITGKWMQEHPADLAWLRGLAQDQEISVTWINHSFNHRYSPSLPLSRNFLLEAGTNRPFEILGTEEAMIENGLCPSVFFRFPGLISDASLLSDVTHYGLIPVGSDAWLAKNQAPSFGSIVLVHGNGNEPLGIEKFLDLVKAERHAIREKNWLLFDLRDAVAREEEDQ